MDFLRIIGEWEAGFVFSFFFFFCLQKAQEMDIFVCVGIKAGKVEGRRRERATGRVVFSILPS